MFYNDHAPPHFHALYGEFEAIIDLARGLINAAQFPVCYQFVPVHRCPFESES